MSPIAAILLFFSLLLLIDGAEKSCGAPEQCKMPRPNLRDLVICRTTDIFSDSSMDGIIQDVATQFCNGKTVDEIINEFKQIAQRHADTSTYAKLLAVMNPYNDCLKSVGSNMDKALDQFKTGFKQAWSKIIQDGVKAMAEFKGKCTEDKMFIAMAKYMCPLYNHANIQSIVDKVKAAQGAATFGCAMKCLDKKVCFLSYYA